MRSLASASSRWHTTLSHNANLSELRRAVMENGPDSPCITGCRSVCWKAFILSNTSDTTNWTHVLLESRSTYASLRDHFLKYIEHPEYLTAGNSDPLADDPNSPWNTYRQDEILRAEILQDVQRLPDEPFYHRPHIQTLITDVLFIYCKLNPDVGGYRQGMHELLAPIVYVVDQDAINPADAAPPASEDLMMVEMLDASFIEHDSFALFSEIMHSAKPFYETVEAPEDAGGRAFSLQSSKSSIVEKSEYIHEVCLYKVDPELSNHLKNIEILPQVFLIRWIRLLFSREFPFDQMLVLWDTLFAVDPTFQLIDLICTSMLLRIRWDLLEADYTVALQLLLKYPAPGPPNGPHTFVDDAVYLRDHLDPSGGAELIRKYTGNAPSPRSTPRPSASPKEAPTSSFRKRMPGARSPLSTSRFRPPQGGVEALFQGAAKNVLEQSERLGLNQAVRDAVIEIRRNVQEAKSSMKTNRDLFSEPRSNAAMHAVAVMDRRNGKLASMLAESVTDLKALGDSELEDKVKIRDALEAVTAKLQTVKGFLEDSTATVPDNERANTSPSAPSSSATERRVDSEPLSNAVATMALNTQMEPDPETSADPDDNATPKGGTTRSSSPANTKTKTTQQESESENKKENIDIDPLGVETPKAVQQQLKRPQPPIPTRSTLAQSSFSWMLEPDDTASSASSTSHHHHHPRSGSASGSVFGSDAKKQQKHRKRPSANANRERTAFLFGDAPSSEAEDIFGLEPIISPVLKKKGTEEN
ncbi:rab-GTPase-TBC domain-containing protein, partial [Poronia punctata]